MTPRLPLAHITSRLAQCVPAQCDTPSRQLQRSRDCIDTWARATRDTQRSRTTPVSRKPCELLTWASVVSRAARSPGVSQCAPASCSRPTHLCPPPFASHPVPASAPTSSLRKVTPRPHTCVASPKGAHRSPTATVTHGARRVVELGQPRKPWPRRPMGRRWQRAARRPLTQAPPSLGACVLCMAECACGVHGAVCAHFTQPQAGVRPAVPPPRATTTRRHRHVPAIASYPAYGPTRAESGAGLTAPVVRVSRRVTHTVSKHGPGLRCLGSLWSATPRHAVRLSSCRRCRHLGFCTSSRGPTQS